MARLIALFTVKHDGGTAQPGDAFEGDEVLIATGAAVADPSPVPTEPEKSADLEKSTRVVRRAAAEPAPAPDTAAG